MENHRYLTVICAAIVIAGFLSGGIYSISASGQGTAYVANRFTGKVWYCYSGACSPIESESNPLAQ